MATQLLHASRTANVVVEIELLPLLGFLVFVNVGDNLRAARHHENVRAQPKNLLARRIGSVR